MNRRRFLHGIGLASLVAASGVRPSTVRGQSPDDPPTTPATGDPYTEVPDAGALNASPQIILGRMLKGTTDGKVLESLDGGAAWQTIANFGEHCSVALLSRKRSEILALIYVQGYSFTLHSGDGRVWRTDGADQVSA